MKRGSKISIDNFVEKIRKELSGRNLLDDEIRNFCEIKAFECEEYQYDNFSDKKDLAEEAYSTLRCELEFLQKYADDPSVTEIMVNGPTDIFIEKDNQILKVPEVFESRERLTALIQRIAASVGREMNDLHPILDARLKDGSRINAVHSNIAPSGPILTIRRFTKNKMTMDELINSDCISKDAAEELISFVGAGYNIFISGGTSSGKTTFLNVLTDFIPKNERLIVIEDSLELQVRGHENLVRMETKNSNPNGKGEVTIKDLIKTSLRMRPERIIVGEVRGSEVVDMISAMSTGHDGSLSTGHANSAKGMLKRLESMYLSAADYPLNAVQGQIAQAIEIIVHLERTKDGTRRVSEIAELLGYENQEPVLNRIFERDNMGNLIRKGQIKNKAKLLRFCRNYKMS